MKRAIAITAGVIVFAACAVMIATHKRTTVRSSGIEYDKALLFDIDKFAGYDRANPKTWPTPKAP